MSYHPTAVHYYVISNGEALTTSDGKEYFFPAGSIIVVGEIYTWNGNENEGTKISAYDMGKRLAEYEVSHGWANKMRKGPADNQIFQVRGGAGETIESHLVRGYNDYMEDMFMEINQQNQIKSEFAVPRKAQVTSLYTRADQSHNSRIQGLEILRTYLNASKEDDGRPGIYFTPAAVHAIRTLPSIPRDELRPEDVDTKSEDHCFSGDTLVNTPNGKVKIKELVGTTGEITSINGTVQKYENCRTYGNDDIYRYYMGDGGFIDCTKDHLVMTNKGFQEIDYAFSVGLKIRREQISTQKNTPAQKSVEFITIERKEFLRNDTVYCLDVKGTHCFSVNNGYIVHNCYDSIRYFCMSRRSSFKRLEISGI